MDEYSTIAHVIFGGEVKKRKDRYFTLQKQLRQAHMAQTYEVYVSVAYLTSIILGIVGALLGLLLGFLLGGTILKSTNIANLHLGISIPFLSGMAEIIVLFVSMIILGVIGYIVTYTTFMLIPSFNASERKSKINKALPSAVTFMYAMSKGGADIISIIRSLHEAENTYGEVSKEIGFIIRDMDYFGNDLRIAMLNCVNQTPSDMMQDLLSNLLSVIDSGGDVTSYLNNKVEQYRMRVLQDQKSFLEILGLMAESYVTMFVAGPLFIIIMSSVMTIMNGGSPMILYILVYAVLPIGSVMFVVMISMLTPQEEDRTSLFEVNVSSQYDTVPMESKEASAKDMNKMADIKKARENVKMKEFLANPLASIQKDPIKSLYITIPIALVIIIILMLIWPTLGFGSFSEASNNVTQTQKAMMMGKIKTNGDILSLYGPIISFFDDFIVFFIFIALIPLAYFYEMKNHRERKIASEMPDFLKKLSSTNETGMTLTQSINLISNSNFGKLSAEVQKMHRDMQWGTDVSTALKRFANGLRTNASTKVITLITKASASSGDIKDVLNIAANDARINEQIRRERFDGMLIYVVIIFISFVVFIYCVYTLTSSFIPVMATAATTTTSGSSSASAAAAQSQATFIQAFNPDDYVRLFFHAAIIQGLCAGILAGVMGEGKWMSGLKYALIMIAIAYVLFTLLI